MKVVILAGGHGTRLMEVTNVKPKPMVEIGDMPIIWHIMKIYASQGYNEFVVCLGYKGYVIKEYFANLFLHHSDVTIDVKNNIELQASFTRKYPELEIGSKVKIYKKKTLGQKERVSRFRPAIFTINNITEQHGQKYYNLQDKDR